MRENVRWKMRLDQRVTGKRENWAIAFSVVAYSWLPRAIDSDNEIPFIRTSLGAIRP